MAKKNKSGPKANIFKVAGAKSLKKTKAKPVNLGLKIKNFKQKIADVDKQFVEMSKTLKPGPSAEKPKVKVPQKKKGKNITKEEVSKTAEDIVKMEL